MTPVQFVLSQVEAHGLKLERPELRKLVKQYQRDRLEMEPESARQCVRIALESIAAKKS